MQGEHNPPGMAEAGLHVTMTRRLMQEQAGHGLATILPGIHYAAAVVMETRQVCYNNERFHMWW